MLECLGFYWEYNRGCIGANIGIMEKKMENYYSRLFRVFRILLHLPWH